MTECLEDVPVVVAAYGLTKTYAGLRVVDGVDLVVRRGDVYGLLGPNGAGKTTFMRMLFGLITPDGGRIEVFGQDVGGNPVRALQHVAGFVETPRFYPYLSGRRNLELLARLDAGRPAERIDELLSLVDLADRADKRVREFSYGMVQRLGVAAALMRDPQMLVLDEPTNGLDPAGIRDMRALVRRLTSTGITVLLSSHHMAEVEEICGRVAIMRRGQIAFDGSLAELRVQAVRTARQLETTDDVRAVAVCAGSSGVTGVAHHAHRITFEADDDAVAALSLRLADAGIGVRNLHAPVSALETLFFHLTDAAPGAVDDEQSDRVVTATPGPARQQAGVAS
ncbi:MAG: ABC transporter ATP-binding protein [Ilumatobacteraceae bacterium]